LNFKDGNKRNWKLENLEFLCYNCYFLVIGDVFEKNQLEAMEDYTSLRTKKIDFDISDQKKEILDSFMDIDNKRINKKESVKEDFPSEEYGSELIAFLKK